MNKPITVHSYDEILLSNTKEQTTDASNNIEESKKPSDECKKSVIKEGMLYDYMYVKFWNRENWFPVTEGRLQLPGPRGEELSIAKRHKGNF